MTRPHLALFAMVALFVAIAVTACETSSDIDPRLIECYTDVVVARESSLDTMQAQASVRATLQKHGFTKEQFETDLADVGKDPVKFRALYDSVAKRLAARRDTTTN